MRILEMGRTEKSGRIFVSRIVVAIAVTILLTCLGVASITVNQSYREIRSAHLDRARAHAITAFRAAVDPEFYPTLPQLIDFGNHLVAISPVTGGAYYDAVGDYEAHFGRRPTLTWHTAKLDRMSRVFVDDGNQMEIFVDPNEIGIRHGVALRFDLTDTWAAIDAELARKVTAILATSLASAATLTLLLSAIVLLPISRLQAAVHNVLDDPKDATAHSLNMTRRDEIGQLARGIDQLFYVLSNTFEEDLGNALAIQAHVPYPLVIYSAGGAVEDANFAALDFFGVEKPRQIPKHDEKVLRFDGKPQAVAASLERGQICDYGDVLGAEGWVPCLIGGDVIRRQNGSVRRYFLVLADLSVAHAQLREAQGERRAALEDVTRLRQRTRELRHLLDACLAIIEGGATLDDKGPVRSAMPDRVVNAWYRDAIAHGQMMPRSLRHSVLPPIEVHQNLAERLFANALSAVHGRSGVDHPRILVSARMRDDGIPVFTVSEIVEDASQEAKIGSGDISNANLYLAAFTNLLKVSKGRLVRLAGPNGENTLVFQLPPGQAEAYPFAMPARRTPEPPRAA